MNLPWDSILVKALEDGALSPDLPLSATGDEALVTKSNEFALKALLDRREYFSALGFIQFRNSRENGFAALEPDDMAYDKPMLQRLDQRSRIANDPNSVWVGSTDVLNRFRAQIQARDPGAREISAELPVLGCIRTRLVEPGYDTETPKKKRRANKAGEGAA